MGLPPIATLVAIFCVFVSGREISSSSQPQTPADFDCPEEFGYYAHPTDCTQYYVCVFGGALLESCTGGLMYSHELQTCDWPRNVGCAPGQQQALQQQEIGQDTRQQLREDTRQQLSRQDLRQELARHELRQEARQELRQEPRHELRPEYRQVQEVLRQQPKQQQHHQQQQQHQHQQQQVLHQVDTRGRQRAQITVPKADLYNTEDEELGPAVEELEIDRQQRVYRGQPSTLGQVASDRDGLTHSNAIPVPATGGRDKLSVISYGAQQQYQSKNKPKRTEGVNDLDHNFLTYTPRVRVKRDGTTRASVQPVQQQTYDTRGYNTSRYIQQQQQQQYTDPNYYTVYDEEAEQYKDIGDYAQYIQQNKQDIYTRKKPAVEIVQQEPVQRGNTYQKTKYSSQPENIYQSVTPQEYESYTIQNNDDLYRQVQTKSNNRFPEVKELGSTPGERRLITVSATQGPLPTDSPTRTDRVGSEFRLGPSNPTEASDVVHITPRRRGQGEAPTNSTAARKEAVAFAQEVNALVQPTYVDPVSKILEALAKSGEYLSDEASIEQSGEVDQVTVASTETGHRGKPPLTVEEINISDLKSLNFQSTPSSRFRIASSTPETPRADLNQYGFGQGFTQTSPNPPSEQSAPLASPLSSQRPDDNHQTRKEAQVPRQNNETRKPFVVNLSVEDNSRSMSSREAERQNAKHDFTNYRSRGNVRHHNSGEIYYSDAESGQDYSGQSKEWRDYSLQAKQAREQTTTKTPVIATQEQLRFRPGTVSNILGFTTAVPSKTTESPTNPETNKQSIGTQQKSRDDIKPVSYQIPRQFQREDNTRARYPSQYDATTQGVIGLRSSHNLHSSTEEERKSLQNQAGLNERTTPKPLLIRIPSEPPRDREENVRKLEVPAIRVNNYNSERGYISRERVKVNEEDGKPGENEPASEEARKPVSIKIPEYSPKAHGSDSSQETLNGRKQYIKPRERDESEYERAKPTPIKYSDSMEYNAAMKEDGRRVTNRNRGSSRETYNHKPEPIQQTRGRDSRLREHLNSVTAPESTQPQEPQPKRQQQADPRHQATPNVPTRSREPVNSEVQEELNRPVAFRVPESIDLNQYKTREDSNTRSMGEEFRAPSRTEEAAPRRGEQRSRGRAPEAERTTERSNELKDRFEVATTLRPTNRLVFPSTVKTIVSRPPKKYRNGTIYADQTLPIGTDMTDPPPSSEPDPSIRARPMSNNTPSSPGLTRGSQRHRGSLTYTVSPNEAEPAPASPVVTSPPRGTLPPNRGRPTLKPSNSVVSKAAEFVDIYRFPPRRPENVYPTPQVDKTAAKCRKDVCLLPDCYCGGKDIPGDLSPEETPQIVLLTFDDSVNDLNKGLYSDLFDKGRVNPNGCPISATFYVSHEWTDYSQVQNLYAAGHEIASHSVSHSFGEQFSQKKWTREIAGQREILAAYGGVKLEDIRGMRAPFLAVGGNKMFKMLYDSNFTYDSSMPVYENRPPSWPYTLDYKVFHDCMIPPCPTKSYPGVWEVPMVMWQDLNGGRCSMGDACSNPPTADGVYKMLIKNFERHFTTNRSPFGLFYHAAWFTQPHHKEGFISFLDTINKMPEVWLITNWQAIQWVRDPTPLSRLGSFAPFQCNYQDRPKKCNNPKVCNLWHKSGVRYMRTCQACPDIYPWTGKSGVRNSRVDNDLE